MFSIISAMFSFKVCLHLQVHVSLFFRLGARKLERALCNYAARASAVHRLKFNFCVTRPKLLFTNLQQQQQNALKCRILHLIIIGTWWARRSDHDQANFAFVKPAPHLSSQTESRRSTFPLIIPLFNSWIFMGSFHITISHHMVNK